MQQQRLINNSSQLNMFRAIILPVFRSTRQSGAHEDRQNNCSEHVELTGSINTPIMLDLVSCLYYLYFIKFFLRLAKQSQFIPLQNVVYFITLRFLVRKIFTFYINYVLLFKCPFPGPKG